ncbi:MAG: AsmA-like C-terminal region-containing protein, partial [Nitrospinae bacterium]|nr:AsmA-like C-terminal region-containing protein [Nitrospinota bacterium]
SLDGALKNIFKPEPQFDLRLNGAVSLEDIDSIRFVSYGGIYYQTGLVFAEIGVKGGFKDFHLDYRLDMTGAEYRLLDIIHKSKGTRNIYSFTGSVRGGDKLTIDRLKALVGDSVITVSGKVGQLMAEQGIDIEVESEGANMDDLDKFFLFFDDINGGGKVGGKFSIKSIPGKPIKLAGRLIFNEATFRLPILEGIFYDCSGAFELINNHIFLKKGHGRFNDSPFRITGQGVIVERPEFTLNVEADSLSLQDLFGKPLPEGEKPQEIRKVTLTTPTSTPDWTWNLNIRSRKGDIGQLHYQDLNTRIRYANDMFHIDPLNFESVGGKWRFIGDVALIEDGKAKFDAKIDVVDMEMGRLLAESFGGERTVEGKFNLKIDVAGNGKLWRDMKKTLTGRLEARSGKGVIHRFNLLAKIFSLLNVLQYLKLKTPDLAADGMAFNIVSAGFDLKGGVARTENLMVDSEAMRISAVGSYTVPSGDVDMRVGVMPLVAVDKVLSSIPVAGHVLTGDKKSLIASYYEVNGPLDDPEVNAVPFESLAVGIGGILKRLFELPVNAINAIGAESQGKGSRSDNMMRE